MIQSDELIFFEGLKPSITRRKNGWNHVKPYETSHVPYPPAKWQWKILVYRWFSHYQWIGFREILQENPIIHVWFPVDFPLNQSIDIKPSISKGVPIMFDNQRVDPKSSQGSWSEAEAWFPISHACWVDIWQITAWGATGLRISMVVDVTITTHCGRYHHYHLVGGLEPWNFMAFHHIGNVIIPTDGSIFFRGVGLNHQPAISIVWGRKFYSTPSTNLILVPHDLYVLCSTCFSVKMVVKIAYPKNGWSIHWSRSTVPRVLPSCKLTQTIWNIIIFNGKTHYKWPFSIANC